MPFNTTDPETLIESVFVHIATKTISPTAMPAFVASRLADAPQDPRIVMRAECQGERQEVKISGVYAKMYRVSATFDVPSPDENDPSNQSALCTKAAREFMAVMDDEAALAAALADCAAIAKFDMLVVEKDEEASRAVDNTTFHVEQFFSVTAHLI